MNRKILNFGFVFNFFSSFGQTFFISLFVAYWLEVAQISNTYFGSLYAGLTILSAFLLSVFGKFIDQITVKKFAIIVLLSLFFSVLFLSQIQSIYTLGIGLFLVRFLGQGLMTHTSVTGVAKHFGLNSAKALGIISLGHPISEFILPIVVININFLFGWRCGIIILALFATLILLISVKNINIDDESSFKRKDLLKTKLKSTNYFKESKFWILAGNFFVIPTINTSFFLYQYSVGQSKGWDLKWVAFCFTFYAIFNALALLFSGNIIERYSGRKLFPLYLFPVLLGMLLLAIIDHKLVFLIFYSLLGISSGLGSIIRTSLQVEIYGKENLGKIRGYFSTLVVFSSAIGPPFFGYFIDQNFKISSIMLIFSFFVFCVIILSFRINKVKIHTYQ